MSSSPIPIGTLIPDLPDDLAALILASIPFSHHARLRSTSRAWRQFLSPRPLLSLRRRLRLPPRHLLAVFPSDPSLSPPYLLDPSALAWSPLPPIPCSPHLYGLSNFAAVALGAHLYVLGGSHFDARAYPLGHPRPSPAAYRLDLAAPLPLAWSRLPDMLTPRGSFACAPVRRNAALLVAGGGSRHADLPSDGTRTTAAEAYDVDLGAWAPAERMPSLRAGCVGFVVPRAEREEEFWVMGGYGDYMPISGVVPADIYCRDAVVLGTKSGKWREAGDMWDGDERKMLGPVAVVAGPDGEEEEPRIYMLDQNRIFRYIFASNQWRKESSLRRKIAPNESCGFVAMNGEVYVLTSTSTSTTHCADSSNPRRASKRRPALEIQIYHPLKKEWRFVMTSPPFHRPINFKATILCTIQI